MEMYTKGIKMVVSTKSQTGQARVHRRVNVHRQVNSLPQVNDHRQVNNHRQVNVHRQVNSHLRVNVLPQVNNHRPVSSDNLSQARITGQCNSHTKIGARELKTITVHNSTKAVARVDRAAPADQVVVAEVVAGEAADANLSRLIYLFPG